MIQFYFDRLIVKLGSFTSLVPDKLFVNSKYRLSLGRTIQWSKLERFTEKLQWIKLHDRNPLFTRLVDKYEAKKIVSKIIGNQYVIPTIAVFESTDDIDWDKLPNQFVMKCTHNSGTGLCICRDKTMLDKESAIENIRHGMKTSHYLGGREWPYKNVKPRIIVEQLMKDDNGEDLKDYKFYCFHGVPIYCQVIQGRSTQETIDFYDMDWNHQPFIGLNPSVSNAKNLDEKPRNFEEMKKIASTLSENFKFARIDLYDIKGRVYFGEVTFFPFSGFGVFKPDSYDFKLGELIHLT